VTKLNENPYLGSLELPFFEQSRVSPYVDYLRTILAVNDISSQFDEQQSGSITVVGAGQQVELVTDDVPPGFTDTYVNLTWFLSTTQITAVFGREHGNIATPTLMGLALWPLTDGFRSNILGSLPWLAQPFFNTPGPLTIYSGERLRMELNGALLAGNDLTIDFMRFRRPGSVTAIETVDEQIHTP